MIPWRLIISHLKQNSTPEDDLLFREWLMYPGNQELFNELKELWERIKDTVSSDEEPDTDYYWKEMQSRMKENRKSAFISRLKPLLSVASVVAILAMLISFFYTNWLMGDDSMQTFTSMNGKSKIVLPDSSIVWLNKGTTIHYSGTFSRKRNISLEGEASFEVKKDTDNPFVVSTGGIRVKVYGTQFNIHSEDQSKDVKIALIEGSVSVIDGKKEAFLNPGEVCIFDKTNHSILIVPGCVDLETFWAKENVHFEHKSLGYICKYLERWYGVEIKLDSSLAESQFYTFTLGNESLEMILRIISRINPIQYSFTDHNHVKITAINPENKMPMK